MPRAPVQYHRDERFEQEGAHVVDPVARRRLDPGRAHDDHRGDVEGHEDLGVGVVAEQDLAPQPAGHGRHLVPPVPDPVDVGVPPGELEEVVAVPRVRVGHRQPAEGGPEVRVERLRYYLTHSVR